ncbi:hypothetical protein [Pseudochrobactrum lubricantis]|uniref:hypothetical protein n=1 Tax=Pseudochrobactrum lubricantis TaxID=558172 RepID=UPI0035E38C40
MIIQFLISKLRKLLGLHDDPLLELRATAETLKATIAKAKKDKKRYSHLERELLRTTAVIVAIERGIPYRNGSLDWGR